MQLSIEQNLRDTFQVLSEGCRFCRHVVVAFYRNMDKIKTIVPDY